MGLGLPIRSAMDMGEGDPSPRPECSEEPGIPVMGQGCPGSQLGGQQG